MRTLDPIRTRTNLVKSFIKAGIFPLNSNSIDRARISRNKTNVDKYIYQVFPLIHQMIIKQQQQLIFHLLFKQLLLLLLIKQLLH